jgi:hypothetical protein
MNFLIIYFSFKIYFNKLIYIYNIFFLFLSILFPIYFRIQKKNLKKKKILLENINCLNIKLKGGGEGKKK